MLISAIETSDFWLERFSWVEPKEGLDSRPWGQLWSRDIRAGGTPSSLGHPWSLERKRMSKVNARYFEAMGHLSILPWQMAPVSAGFQDILTILWGTCNIYFF